MPESFSDLESRLTETARASLERAGILAKNSGSSYIGTEHVLLGVLAQNSSLGAKILAESDVTLDRVELALNLTSKAVVLVVVHKGISKEVMEMLRSAWQLALEFGQSRIGTEHIIYSILLQRDARATKLLKDMSVNLEELRGDLEQVFDKQQYEAMKDEPAVQSAKKTSSEMKLLEKFGIDVTERATQGLIDPVVGRNNETKRLITILGRRTKNNPALIGEPGVGKTAVVEGLAQRIADGDVPPFLLGKRIVQLNLAAMVAGTKYRGQFEERLNKVLTITQKHQEIILFVDEMHLLVGAGSAEGSMDAANVLKPALARGQVRLIGATTFDEYRKHIEKDTALSRRFQSVTIDEPSPDEAIMMLRGLSSRLSAHHQLSLTDESVELAVKLSERYITDRQLPDKAIDVLDEAASLFRSNASPKQSKRQKIAQRLQQVANQIDEAVEYENYQRAAECKIRMKHLEEQIAQLPAEDATLPIVPNSYIYKAMSEMTNIPLERLSANETKSLIKLEQRLGKSILGQDEAISQLAKTIRRAKAGLHRGNGPIGSFIFTGPTGVGKTELARVLANEVFGGDDNLIKIDMSEMGERHTISRLIGAPAGYVGYEDGGTLTEKIRRHPYSVVLFDEIEKAHPDTMNILLQLLEDGKITDAAGKSVSFRQTIIILTSNVGSQHMVRESELGFLTKNNSSRALDEIHEQNSREAIGELENIMKPELIGRFDSILTFRALTRPVVGKIFDNLVREYKNAMDEQGKQLDISPAVKRHIISQGFDKRRGARVLRRTIQTELGDPLADALIKSGNDGTLFVATLSKNKVKIDVQKS